MSRSASSPPLACRIQTRSPMRSPSAAVAEHRRLHLAGALVWSAAARPAGTASAAGPASRCPRPRSRRCTGWPPRPGPRTTGSAYSRAGCGWNFAVGVEQRRADQAGARGELGDRLVGRGGLERAGAAAVDELKRGQRADAADRLGPPLVQLRRRAGLHRLHDARPAPGRRAARRRGRRSAPRSRARRPARTRAAEDRLGEQRRLGGRAQRRAPGADLHDRTAAAAAARTCRGRGRPGSAGGPAPSVASMKSRWPAESMVIVMCCRAASSAASARSAARSAVG